jgi:hypothetical protein
MNSNPEPMLGIVKIAFNLLGQPTGINHNLINAGGNESLNVVLEQWFAGDG